MNPGSGGSDGRRGRLAGAGEPIGGARWARPTLGGMTSPVGSGRRREFGLRRPRPTAPARIRAPPRNHRRNPIVASGSISRPVARRRAVEGGVGSGDSRPPPGTPPPGPGAYVPPPALAAAGASPGASAPGTAGEAPPEGTPAGYGNGPEETPPEVRIPPEKAPPTYLLLLVPVALIAGGIALYYFVEHLRVIPLTYELVFRLALVFALGYLILRLVGRVLESMAPRWAGPRRGARILSVYRIIAYTALFVALLETAGVSSLALLAGGTFAGLVLGLAGQTVLANVLAGVYLLFVRPFELGDRITVTTWQYGLLAPAYPPKFYSQDLLVPGFTGVVTDIGIAYTSLHLDDGTQFRMPNSILIQAGLITHEVRERWVRLKYELPPSVPPEILLPLLANGLASNPWIARPESLKVRVNQATQASYVISIDALCKGNLEEPPRSALLIATMRLVRPLLPSPAPPAPAPPARSASDPPGR